MASLLRTRHVFAALSSSALATLAACGNFATPAPDGGTGADAPAPTHDAAADHHSSTSKDGGTGGDVTSHTDARHDSGEDAPAHVESGAHEDGHATTEAGGTPDAEADAAKTGDAGHDAGHDAGPVMFDAGLYDAGPAALRYVGRIDYNDPAGPRFEWPGTEVIARFTGSAITIQMNDYGNYFNVIIDGVLQPTPVIGSGSQTDYPLATGLSATGIHEAILYRRTEPDVSTTQITGVTFPAGGTLLPQGPPSSRRIEVIGDSITCGLGALGMGPNCDATNDVEDHYVTYEAVTARALGADLHTTSWSGEGVFRNYDNSTLEPTLPGLYPYTLPGELTSMWDFSSWVPQAVVINLGTNDFSSATNNDDPGMGFQTAYYNFLTTIRTNYPHAYIICANGPLLTDPDFTTAENYIKGAIAQRNAKGDTNLSYLSFGIQDGSLGYGCDYHPTVAEHAQMALTLEAALSSALNW